MKPAPISVGIPTYGRGLRVISTIERLMSCDPAPSEIIVHIDGSNEPLQAELSAHFPFVRQLFSPSNVGSGGGRHRCIKAASQSIFATFDDDSWPTDSDFFAEVIELFGCHPHVAVLGTTIYTRDQPQPVRTAELLPTTGYVGCGYAIRKEAYDQTSGSIERVCSWGIEEIDVAIQLYALGWQVLECRNLLVFHDTTFAHREAPAVTAGMIQNAALHAYLRYPAILWPYGFLQLGSSIFDAIKRRRFSGLGSGLVGLPRTLAHYKTQRRPLPVDKVCSYLRARPRLAK